MTTGADGLHLVKPKDGGHRKGERTSYHAEHTGKTGGEAHQRHANAIDDLLTAALDGLRLIRRGVGKEAQVQRGDHLEALVNGDLGARGTARSHRARAVRKVTVHWA